MKTVLVAPAADIAHEYYLGLIVDRAAKAITVIASAEGGIEIEETAKTIRRQSSGSRFTR